MGQASGAQGGDRTLSLTHRYLSWGLAHSLTQHSRGFLFPPQRDFPPVRRSGEAGDIPAALTGHKDASARSTNLDLYGVLLGTVPVILLLALHELPEVLLDEERGVEFAHCHLIIWKGGEQPDGTAPNCHS